MELQLLIRWNRNQCFNLFLLDECHACCRSTIHAIDLVFLNNLVTSTIMNAKSLMKHWLNCAMLLNTYISYGLVRTSMFTNAYIFLGFSSFPYLKTMNLKIILENTIKNHFLGFKLISYSLRFKKHCDLKTCPVCCKT
jgi:hypothetical protein